MKKLLSFLLVPVVLMSLAAPMCAADFSVTAGSVLASSTAVTRTGTAGATITAGQVVYKHSGGTYKLAKADAVATAQAVGIALHGASSGQPLKIVVKDDDFTPGASSTEGMHVQLSSGTAGGITGTAADVTTGAFPFLIGIVLDGGHWKIDFEAQLRTDSALP